MRILSSLTYYTPHISGLTLYARYIHGALARRGHEVTVMTSRYDRSLPREERIDGVRVIRNRVWARLSKGVLMPGYFVRACRALHHSDVLYLHLPQIEAVVVALYAKLLRKPILTVYQCDLELPNGIARVLFTPLIKLSHTLTVMVSDRILCTSEDYVRHSRFLRHFQRKIEVCYPPCLVPQVDPADRLQLDVSEGAPVIGYVGRFAEEKGIAYILDAAPRVVERYPKAVFALVGACESTFGERVFARLRPRIDGLGDHVRLLGVVSDSQLADFYRRCDMLLLPSTNSTEAFGMVQVEAMLCGTPVIASDIPGVREPVRITGAGLLVPPRDGAALAGAICNVLGEPRERFRRTPEDLDKLFGLERAADFYETLLAKLTTQLAANEEPVAVARQ